MFRKSILPNKTFQQENLAKKLMRFANLCDIIKLKCEDIYEQTAKCGGILSFVQQT